MRKMIKKKILSWLIIVSVIIVGLNVAAGIIQANSYGPKVFGFLIDNQTGESITSIDLLAKPYGQASGPQSEYHMIASFSEMLPGNFERFDFHMKHQEEVSSEKADLTLSVQLKDEESVKYPVEGATGIPIKVDKQTLIRLVGNKVSGFKVEYVNML